MAKIIKFIKTYQRDIIFLAILALVFASAYNIGKIRGAEITKPEVEVTRRGAALIQSELDNEQDEPETPAETPEPAVDFSKIQVIASKNSKSKLYHFLWCPSAPRIKEENRITFTNENEAIKSGYTLAGNCTK